MGLLALKFYSESCGPCKALSRMLDNAGLHQYVIDMNVDKEEEAVAYFHIKSVPTVVVVDENNRECIRWNGLFDVKELKEILKQK